MIDGSCVNLPQGVKLLAVRDGELAGPVLVYAVVHDLSFVEQTQSVGVLPISLPDPAHARAHTMKET